ncbi:MAG: DUF4625 domain-containing protein [Bacteroidota bacterium]
MKSDLYKEDSLMYTPRLFLYVVSLLMISLWGCKGEVDLDAPTFEVVLFDPAPRTGTICGAQSENVFFLASGQALTFEYVFRDNEGLSQYKIDIHHNFDCHGHARSVSEDWTVLEVVDLSGLEQRVSRTFTVPDNVTAGAYHFHVQVIDLAGNESTFANFFDLKIINTIDTVAPQMVVSTPEESQFSLARGEDLRFMGSVRDNYSLGEGGNGGLVLTYEGVDGGNLFEATRIEWPESQGDRADFDFSFEIPRTIPTGTYEFVLSAFDGINNESERRRYTIEVTQ